MVKLFWDEQNLDKLVESYPSAEDTVLCALLGYDQSTRPTFLYDEFLE
jgi:hypothetical protein